MKILTDFDGTLTNIQNEYEALIEIIDKRIENKHFPVDAYKRLYHQALEEIHKDFTAYGWPDHDRITAYSDEDLFMNIIAGMKLVDQWLKNKPEYANLLEILESQNTSLMEISEYGYFILNTKPIGPHNTAVPDAVKTIQTLLDHGHEVVVVSNSPSDRIIQKLSYAGLNASIPELAPSAALKVRGNAAKYRLGETPVIQSYVRQIDINRPVYKKLLAEEKPDIVIGDVFSLDLALPCYLTQTHPDFSKTKVLLMQQPYTPEWAIDAIQQQPSGVLCKQFSDLLSLVD